MHIKFCMQRDKYILKNNCNNKREDATEADGLGDTQPTLISSLPTMNHNSALCPVHENDTC